MICDTIANFNKWLGNKVNFLTGTDEHGQKVEKSALKANMDPQTFTEDRHINSVKHLWNILVNKGDIYIDKYSGWYSIRDEAFYSNDEVIEDKNGKKLAPNGSEVEWLEEPSYFFNLSNKLIL